MAPKKGMNRSAILNQLSATGTKAQSEMLEEAKAELDMKEYIKKSKKEDETLPIELLDSAPPEWNFFH